LKLPRATAVALLLGWVAAACTSDLELALDGRACTPGPRPCVDGYVCGPQSQKCVLPAELAAGAASGSGGTSAQGGASGAATAGASGGVETGGGGQGGSAAGTGGASGSAGASAGSAGVSSADAGPSGDAGCALTLYRDGDGDGVGDIANRRVGCLEPGWVTQPGDCRDDLPEVFLGQTLFFSESYADVAGASFDYDCSDTEEPDPSNSPLTTPPDCAGLSLTCTGSGYLPASPLRSGAGVEPRCGSNLRRDCVTMALGCGPQDTPLDESLIFRCH
jgi:hypothetical protein